MQLLQNELKEDFDINYHKHCYICKQFFSGIQQFYDQMCKQCNDFNFAKRTQTCDLSNKTALLTGGRIKIGYQIGLILLRNKCTVIMTTRFPKDCLIRYSKEEDFCDWQNRLQIYGLDLRNLKQIVAFCNYVKNKYSKLDILINNAAQTLKYQPEFYENMLDVENKSLKEIQADIKLSNNINDILPQDFGYVQQQRMPIENGELDQQSEQCSNKISLSVLSSTQKFEQNQDLSNIYPKNCTDINGQQIDTSSQNTWTKEINDISFYEFVEVQLINSWAPYILIQQLNDFMQNGKNYDQQDQIKFIINVTAKEGKFANIWKNSRHPHTNMSKAALNMLTRTLGQRFAKQKIYINAVDTGWVSEMLPQNYNVERTVPLDEVDGAMRVLDPIFIALNEKTIVYSKLFKDYKICPDW